MKEWKYTAKTGAMERGNKRGGIDFIRYQNEVLKPLFIPFMQSLGPGYIAQEDNAGPHASNWNREYWAASAIELMTWPPNSPDLSAIECPWWALKVKQGKKGPIHGRKFLTAFWPKHWQSFPLKKLQRYVERIQGNIEWVIRCLGGNEYKEGTKSPVLEEAERDQLNRDIEEFLGSEDPEEEQGDPLSDIMFMLGRTALEERLDEDDLSEISDDSNGDD